MATVAATSTLAYALRPANYLYWCLAFSLLLLLLTDFDRPNPWYTAAVRAGLVRFRPRLTLAVATDADTRIRQLKHRDRQDALDR